MSLETKDGPYFFFKIRPLHSAKGEIKLGDFLFPLDRLDALEFGPDRATRQNLAFRGEARSLGAGTLKIAGALHRQLLAAPRRSAHARLHARARAAGAALPPLRSTAGWAAIPKGQLRVNGPFTDALIEADVRRGEALIEGLPVTSLSTHLRLGSDGILRFDPIQGGMAGGQVAGAIEVDLGERANWRARLSLKSVDPNRIPPLPRELAKKLTGRLDARFRLFGSLVQRTDHIAVDDIDGTLERSGGGKLPKKSGNT